MNEESLIEKRSLIETRFNELAAQKTEIEGELLRLQGEYRAINELIDKLPKKELKNGK